MASRNTRGEGARTALCYTFAPMRRVLTPLVLACFSALALGTHAAAQSGPEAPAPAGTVTPAAEPLDFTDEVTVPSQPHVAAPPTPTAPARDTPRAAAPPLRLNALNLSVLGFAIGAVRLTYERMLLPKHGVFGEAIVMPDVLRGFQFVGVGGAVGYRFHWHGAKTSAFVGGTLSVTRARGTVPTFRLGDDEFPEFRGSVWTIGIAPHIGKRWLFERSGVNLTLRVGGGLAVHVVDEWRGTEPGAKRNLQRSFLITDGELSVGYSF